MDAGLLAKVFGHSQEWQGPCTVVLDAEASIQTIGNDSIQGGGSKVFAPRCISGRVVADSVCLLKDGTALIVMQQHKIRQATGEETIKQLLTVVDPKCVVAVEFPDVMPMVLQTLGVGLPPVRPTGSHSGVVTRPRQLS
jgi:hypothetical protein